ncbi:LGFP repeat-containing protein [Streptosporangium sp. V21-05]|uniref:LGFP repeat-containing protein n=1 Tax=Streptosporangium sp. V21-05 TaxID=3446115 RepID=UPI003F539EC5
MAALLTAAVAAGALAGPARASTTGGACDASLVAGPGSLIGGLWRSNGGENSVYGCPVTRESGYPDKRGSWQRFRNGRIGWSPNLGNNTLVRVYLKGDRIVFKWSGLGRDWDFFNVRWNKNGGRATGVKTGRLSPWSGQYLMSPSNCVGEGREEACTTTNGGLVDRFAFTVQGCDNTGVFQLGSDCGPWSIPVSIGIAR